MSNYRILFERYSFLLFIPFVPVYMPFKVQPKYSCFRQNFANHGIDLLDLNIIIYNYCTISKFTVTDINFSI